MQSVMRESASYLTAAFVKSSWLSVVRRDPREGSGLEDCSDAPFQEFPRAGLPKPLKTPPVPLNSPCLWPVPPSCHGLLSEDSLELDITGMLLRLLW